MPAALWTGRKQFPLHEIIKIKLSVNSPKVTASNLIIPAVRAITPHVTPPCTMWSGRCQSQSLGCVCARASHRPFQEIGGCSSHPSLARPSWQRLLPAQSTEQCSTRLCHFESYLWQLLVAWGVDHWGTAHYQWGCQPPWWPQLFLLPPGRPRTLQRAQWDPNNWQINSHQCLNQKTHHLFCKYVYHGA